MPERPKIHRTPGSSPRERNRRYDATPQRRADHAFYCSSAWLKLRSWFLSTHALCCRCEAEGRIEPAVVCDHIIPRHQRPDLELNERNLRGLCLAHHNAVRKEQQQ